MTDAFDALQIPIEPVDPDPEFAARLRRRIEDALLATTPITRGGSMMTETSAHEIRSVETLAWGPSITPYVVVADARRAVEWYVDVFGGHQRGEMYVNEDGTIGHAEVGIGDAVLMIAEASSLYDVPVAAPDPQPRTHSHTIHVQVDDADVTTRRAADGGASVERQPVDEPYGRVAVIVDPFGHRWMINQPPASATRVRPGDVAYITVGTPDDERAKEFYGAVLGWEFTPGRVERGWQIDDRTPMMGMHGDPDKPGGADLCYRVNDIAAAIDRVRAAGGDAAEPERQDYGLLASCTDDQGTPFQLWQPPD